MARHVRDQNGDRGVVLQDVVAEISAELVAGLGRFNRGMGTEPQLGIAVTAGAEFRLP